MRHPQHREGSSINANGTEALRSNTNDSKYRNPRQKVTRKILHGLRHGCQLGTLIDPTERVVLAYRADRIPDELTKLDVIPCLDDIQLTITVQQLFD